MKKAFILGTALTACIPILLCAFTGCETTEDEEMLPHEIFDNAGKWIDLDFQRQNLTRGWGGLYLNGELIETDVSYPKERIFIINDQAEFDTIFNEFPPRVNFEKEMILLYGFTATSIRQIVIERMKLENERLIIKLKSLAPPSGPDTLDGTAPYMRWVVVKTDKLDIDTVGFTLLNPRG
jgi:hypothetical protein